MMTAHPTRSAGMLCQQAIMNGQFHGSIEATGSSAEPQCVQSRHSFTAMMMRYPQTR